MAAVGSQADLGEARSVTNQAVLNGFIHLDQCIMPDAPALALAVPSHSFDPVCWGRSAGCHRWTHFFSRFTPWAIERSQAASNVIAGR